MHTRFRQPEVASFSDLVHHLNRLVPTSDLPSVYLYLVTDVPAADAGLGTVLSRMVDAEVTDELNADLQNRDETTQEGANGDIMLPPESYELIDAEQTRFRKRQFLVDLYNCKTTYSIFGENSSGTKKEDIPGAFVAHYIAGQGVLAGALILSILREYEPHPWKDTTPTAPNTNTPPHAADHPRFNRRTL